MIYLVGYCCFAYGFLLADFIDFVFDDDSKLLSKKMIFGSICVLLFAPILFPFTILASWVSSSKN